MEDAQKVLLDKVLLDAAEFLEEKDWCQGAFARNSSYESVSIYNLDACKFCLAGAVMVSTRAVVVSPGVHRGSILNAAYEKIENLIASNVTVWNDKPGRTKEEVINALRKAAE